ncbi:MAG: bifunctional 4-hydroxy-2-oxoglutarate aldolase/2-dehydro-3-deoxy-phosphogluconate aldolase [Bacteroidales bacterium]
MAKYTRIEVIQAMKRTGIVPVFYNKNADVVYNAIKACYDGGARVFEFTNRGDFAHEVFATVSKKVASELDGMMLGVGSVIDAPTAALYIQLGANFVVSPILNPDMAKVCNRRKINWSPGCGSLTEINYAEELGADIVKIFPGSQVGGPSFVKAVMGPCPWSSIMPTGGVTPEYDNMKAWFDAGVACVGLGSQLFPKDVVEGGNWSKLADSVRQALDNVAKIRMGK